LKNVIDLQERRVEDNKLVLIRECVREKERENRESVWVNLCERESVCEREWESVFEREWERVCERIKVRMSKNEGECVRVCVLLEQCLNGYQLTC